VIGYSDDEYVWGRVNATVGVGLRSKAVVVIDLSMRVLLRIKDCGCVDISPNLGPYNHSILYGVGHRLISLDILVWPKGMRWLVWRPRDV
jgi:hypothetical protein